MPSGCARCARTRWRAASVCVKWMKATRGLRVREARRLRDDNAPRTTCRCCRRRRHHLSPGVGATCRTGSAAPPPPSQTHPRRAESAATTLELEVRVVVGRRAGGLNLAAPDLAGDGGGGEASCGEMTSPHPREGTRATARSSSTETGEIGVYRETGCGVEFGSSRSCSLAGQDRRHGSLHPRAQGRPEPPSQTHPTLGPSSLRAPARIAVCGPFQIAAYVSAHGGTHCSGTRSLLLCSAVQKNNKSKTNLYENILNKNIGKDFGQTNIRIKSFVETFKSKF